MGPGKHRKSRQRIEEIPGPPGYPRMEMSLKLSTTRPPEV